MRYRVTIWRISGRGRVDDVIEVQADRYEKDGSSYTFFRGDIPVATHSPVSNVQAIDDSEERLKLVEMLNDAIDELSPLLNLKGKNKGVLLHQFINEVADEATLRGLIERVQDYGSYLEGAKE